MHSQEGMMASVLETDRQLEPENRFVLHNIGWRSYLTILGELGDQPHVRLTFDGRNLELMSPSPIHEAFKHLLGRLLETLTLELNIPIRGGGSTTFKRETVERGLEPDECYWIANEQAIRDKTEIDLDVDPPPDLAIEVDISRSALDRDEIYARLGVPEVWRFDGRSLRAYLLQPNGRYQVTDNSDCLPFLAVHELVPFLQLNSQVDETTRIREFAAWARQRFNDQAKHPD